MGDYLPEVPSASQCYAVSDDKLVWTDRCWTEIIPPGRRRRTNTMVIGAREPIIRRLNSAAVMYAWKRINCHITYATLFAYRFAVARVPILSTAEPAPARRSGSSPTRLQPLDERQANLLGTQ